MDGHDPLAAHCAFVIFPHCCENSFHGIDSVVRQPVVYVEICHELAFLGMFWHHPLGILGIVHFLEFGRELQNSTAANTGVVQALFWCTRVPLCLQGGSLTVLDSSDARDCKGQLISHHPGYLWRLGSFAAQHRCPVLYGASFLQHYICSHDTCKPKFRSVPSRRSVARRSFRCRILGDVDMDVYGLCFRIFG